ncbi:MAG: cardiolipin synthase ClsB [Nitrospirae bacterium]|nr:cardiolipin synthase ClsB [Nitrospirota bacterium]
MSAFKQPAIEAILGTPFTFNNHVELLPDGQSTFQKIFDSVKAARELICIEFYIFKDDETGKSLASLLKEKTKEGVKVYVLYDQWGSLMTSNKFWADLRSSGVHIRASRPFRWSSPRLYTHRDHKKLLIVDGGKAFTGGFNIADEYHGYFKTHKKAWRDTGIYLEGQISKTLFELFKKSWLAWKGEAIIYETNIEPLHEGVPVIPIFANSAKSRRRMRKLFFHSINSAREGILITTAYFTPSHRIITALQEAVKRGVKVKILLPGKSDIPVADYVSRSSYTRLLRGGIDIYTYEGKILHAKTAVFDGCWSIVGSANLDFQSLRRNDEGNVGILDNDFGRRMLEIFEEDLQHSLKIEHDIWANRPFREKVLEGFLSILRKRL